MGIIDKTPAEIQRDREVQRERDAAAKHAEALRKRLALDAKELLPYVVANSITSALTPVELVDRAFEIARVMAERMLEAGVELVEPQIPIIGGPNGTMPAALRSILENGHG